MKAVYNFSILVAIRLGFLLSLIFFVFLFLPACRQNTDEKLRIVWENKQATAIAIPKSFLKKVDSTNLLQIRLVSKETPILGSFGENGKDIIFTPLIPFSPGLGYQVFFRDEFIGKINIPLADATKPPVVVAVYPSADTLPENLLKFYFQFSAPMREAEALQHIFLMNDRNDTLRDVFLDLQPELWNEDRTVLTLWLDPGRIKRDLIPNKKMGNPLRKGQQYNLVVAGKWKDARGISLQKQFNTYFWVGARDSLSPQFKYWKMQLPVVNTRQPLHIEFNEPLDYFLLKETIRIIDDEENKISGRISIRNKERILEFTPAQPWQEGMYRLRVNDYLEDLAGNNLERVFDRDINVPAAKSKERVVEKEFLIKRSE